MCCRIADPFSSDFSMFFAGAAGVSAQAFVVFSGEFDVGGKDVGCQGKNTQDEDEVVLVEGHGGCCVGNCVWFLM